MPKKIFQIFPSLDRRYAYVSKRIIQDI